MRMRDEDNDCVDWKAIDALSVKGGERQPAGASR